MIEKLKNDLTQLAGALVDERMVKAANDRRAALFGLLKEVEDVFGPLLVEFKAKIEKTAPSRIIQHGPGCEICFSSDLNRTPTPSCPGLILRSFTVDNWFVHLGWDGKLGVQSRHLDRGRDHVVFRSNEGSVFDSLRQEVQSLREGVDDCLRELEAERDSFFDSAAKLRAHANEAKK